MSFPFRKSSYEIFPRESETTLNVLIFPVKTLIDEAKNMSLISFVLEHSRIIEFQGSFSAYKYSILLFRIKADKKERETK